MALGAILNIMTLCQREKVMIDSGRCPTRIRSMADNAIGRETAGLVVWVAGLVIIGLMARDALGGKACIGSIGMTLGTVLNIMPLGQWEKVVIDGGRCPSGIRAMTGNTIG